MRDDIKKMLEYLGQMTIFEIYGFGKLVGAEENDDFQEYLTNVLVKYGESPKKMRREIFKLAKQIVEDKKSEKLRDSTGRGTSN